MQSSKEKQWVKIGDNYQLPDCPALIPQENIDMFMQIQKASMESSKRNAKLGNNLLESLAYKVYDIVYNKIDLTI